MLLAQDLQCQIRGELAVVEVTTVSIPDLLLALGRAADVLAMRQWLCSVVPIGTAVEHDLLHQQFVLRRRRKCRASGR
jgi:hypothetical protein